MDAIRTASPPTSGYDASACSVKQNASGARIVLATLGTLGDLNPFIGIAVALRDAGFAPVVVTHEEYRSLVDAAGIDFYPMRPDRSELQRASAMDAEQLFRAVRARPQTVLTRYVLPYLEQSYEDAAAALAEAHMIFSSSLSFGAKLAAEKRGVPHVSVVLQPGMMASAHDPPVLTSQMLPGRLLGAGGLPVRRALLRAVHRISRRWVRPVDSFRARLGLPAGQHPLFEGQSAADCTLGLYSAVLGGPQPDHPARFSIAGFSFYDGAGTVPPSLQQFLDDGPAPLVFTLGTSAVHDSTRFVRVALQSLAVLQERAILILDDAQIARLQGELPSHVQICGYVPYSQIFPRARIIIHHGGIGTTAQALRAGRPQLIAPYFVDQPDNAARVVRCGAGRVLPLDRWEPRRLTSILRQLLLDRPIAERAAAIAADLTQENGPEAAVQLATRLSSNRT